MAIEIVAYQRHHVPAVEAFNARLLAGGSPYRFPESDVPAWLPPAPGERLYQEIFLAVEGADVRGGYLLKHQDFAIGQSVQSVGAFQLPLSEGAVDPAYSLIGIQLLRHALRRQPLLYALGIGSYEEEAARLLLAARFEIAKVPFFFRAERPAAFLRQIEAARTSRLRRLGLDVAAATGLGAVGMRFLQRERSPVRADVRVQQLAAFDSAVDAVWGASAGALGFAAVRDRATLRRLYDEDGNRFTRLGLADEGGLRGWVVLLSTRKSSDKYFGDLNVGSIVDLQAVPGFERAVIVAAVEHLRRDGVDIIVTNQSLGGIREGLRQSGFLSGPSNFLFCASPGLRSLIGPLEAGLATFHLGRGDGDGPIHL